MRAGFETPTLAKFASVIRRSSSCRRTSAIFAWSSRTTLLCRIWRWPKNLCFPQAVRQLPAA